MEMTTETKINAGMNMNTERKMEARMKMNTVLVEKKA